ncbi:hypothetical protein [Streptomyces sp. NPDC031705]|uniref:hypothetical protein n=1 Tax=Streptomyces sp. NPDC031705 TaxID=3155729 RepID=UPI0034043D05
MSLREHGFALVGLGPVPGAVAVAFREPPYRVVRLRMSWTADDDWLFLPVPSYDAPYDVPYEGTERRLEAGLAALLRRALGGPWLDVHTDWLISMRCSPRGSGTLRGTYWAWPPLR